MASLSDRVEKAKTDKTERDDLVREYMPFILSCASRQVGRYVEIGMDDEIGVAMSAFDEAIQKFDCERGGFLAFSKRVIARRLTDDYRKRKAEERNMPFDFDDGNNPKVRELESFKSSEAYREKREMEERQEEIAIFKRELESWGIAFEDLVKNCPKHERLRRSYKEVAIYLTRQDCLMEDLMRTRRLPIKKLEEKMGIPRKKLDRGRIYILSLIVVLTGDYRFIRDYIDWR